MGNLGDDIILKKEYHWALRNKINFLRRSEEGILAQFDILDGFCFLKKKFLQIQ